MLDRAGHPVPPTDVGQLARRLVQLERLVELGGGARTMVSASVGHGGIRVTKGGSITVEDGGRVIIESGDLVLGAGKIDGAALKSQLEPRAYNNTSTGFALGTGFAARGSVRVQPPSWATQTIVQGFGIASVRSRDNTSGFDDEAAEIRVIIDGNAGLENVMPQGARGKQFWASGNATHARATTSRDFRVETQLRARTAGIYPSGLGSRSEIAVTCLFVR